MRGSSRSHVTALSVGLALGAAGMLVAVPRTGRTSTVDHTPRPSAHTSPGADAPLTAPLGSAQVRGDAEAPLVIEVEPIVPGSEPIQPLPSVEEYLEDFLEIDYEPEVIELGRMLFHDARLSHDDTVSCASCHDLRYGGADRSSVAIGVDGQLGPINTPSVFNATLQIAQFWDGRAEDLETQADGPPNAPKEMGSNWKEISSKLLADPAYREGLERAFGLTEPPAPFPPQYWLGAIAAFEQTLITPDAPFDRYLRGDEEAVPREAKEGYQVFKDVGCIECHRGLAIGGRSFQRLGRENEYFGEHAADIDLGRYNVTGNEEDRHFFKVPGLRNVAVTAPYFHDGSQQSLAEAVRLMGFHQLNVELSDAQVDRLVVFLESLTGTYRGRPLVGSDL